MSTLNSDKSLLSPFDISELVAQVTESHLITSSHRYLLKAALLETSLNEEEQRSLNRLLRGVRLGRVKVAEMN